MITELMIEMMMMMIRKLRIKMKPIIKLGMLQLMVMFLMVEYVEDEVE